MATIKLTLSMDEDTIQTAKRIASESNMSVSKLFKNLITAVETEKRTKDPVLEKIRNTEIPDWIKQLSIVSKPTPDFDHKAEYHKHLEEKYGV
ncbi:DUF6364 family protein [Mucilaginibacter sp.]|uniref:DUF6364 family protein n=1 Tax=Mucilaginibacter sp. TaxID=1882438 RepID=UPI00284412EE|nr:DUF6364 family protein [Mucilaginibacter sp.]MDR3695839.1 DUF6364 family protein [Mucilaginibacter sp.]